ncbi:MAG: flagellar biosynthetic protein FliO [Treponema sp.]|jgi:flagellar protein FliO/FliZ|nr:flagellar biosynthetic protein FliO [Treponema sp.]
MLYAQTDAESASPEPEIQLRDGNTVQSVVPAPQINSEEQNIRIGGDETGDATDATANAGLSTFFLILRLVVVLLAVTLAIYGVVFFLKKLSRTTARQGQFVKVLASVSLGANKAAHVIAVGSKAWLVGDTENGGVSLIAELTDQETIDAMLLEDSRRNAEIARKAGFTNLFRSVSGHNTGALSAETGAGNDKTTGAAVTGPTADRLRKTRERLQDMQ